MQPEPSRQGSTNPHKKSEFNAWLKEYYACHFSRPQLSVASDIFLSESIRKIITQTGEEVCYERSDKIDAGTCARVSLT